MTRKHQPRTFAAISIQDQESVDRHITMPGLRERELSVQNGSSVWFNRGYVQYNPSELATRKGLKIFDEMRRDEQIKNALDFKRAAILSTGWEVLPPEGADEDHEPTRFVRYVLKSFLQGNLDRCLREVLSAIAYGFSVSEKVYAPIPRGVFAGKWGLRSLKTRRPHDFEFATDQHGNIEPDGIIQIQNGTRKRLPVGKFFVHVHCGEFGNIYGKSDLEPAYQAWWAKSNSYTWLKVVLERMGIPPIVLKYNSDIVRDEDVDELVAMVQAFRNSGGLAAIPNPGGDAIDFWTPELASQAVSVFIPAINKFDSDMARALNAPGLIGVTAETGQAGSYARAETHFDAFLMKIEEERGDLQDNVNDDIIRQLMTVNYGSDVEMPTWRLLPLDDGIRADLLEKWLSAIEKGIVEPQVSDEDHIRKHFKFPDREDERLPRSFVRDTVQMLDLIRGGLLSRELAARMKGIDVEEIDAMIKADQDRADSMDLVLDTDARRTTQAGLSPSALTQGVPSGIPGFPEKAAPKAPGDEPAVADPADPKAQMFASEAKIIKFAEIEKVLDATESVAHEELVTSIAETRDALVAAARKQWAKPDGPDAKFINDATLRKWGSVTSTIVEMQRAAFDQGREDLRTEVARAAPKKFAADARQAKFIPKAAIEFLKERARLSSLVVRDRVQREVRNALAKSMENGETTQQMVARLGGVFDPYVGDSEVLRDGQPLEAWQIENIVRTNTTAAYNHGRIIEARRPDTSEFVLGMRYSATLDSRTTEVCSYLHGRVFRPEDSALDELIPPNHYMCRSILVPVPVGVPISDSDFVTNAESGKGKDLAGKGFI